MELPTPRFPNPFKPGAGHMPPYLAGRQKEALEFKRLLGQTTILDNMVMTGLRGVGKTVLLESLKPVALQEDWLWVGTDLSESVSLREDSLATRIMTDLSMVTARIPEPPPGSESPGLIEAPVQTPLDASFLRKLYDDTPGLVADKLKHVLEYLWSFLPTLKKNGVVFAYDEAQTMTDQAQKDHYPLSLMLDVFQSLQRKNMRFLLVLTGLPTLFPKLVAARAYSERMFRVLTLESLKAEHTQEAIVKPMEDARCPVRFNEKSVDRIVKLSGGYPYFIQFLCKEVYDTWWQQSEAGDEPGVPAEALVAKLDTDFYAGRWARVTERQQALLWLIATLTTSESEFTGSAIAEASQRNLAKPMSQSQVNQMLSRLSDSGLVVKNRHGKYCLAVPMFGQFILRTMDTTSWGKNAL